MNVDAWLLWGFIATVVLTVLMATSQGLGMTRMNLPYMLGTAFTGRRDDAKLLGFTVHVANGWIFSLLYIAGFHVLGLATWWLGALGGLLHAVAVLTVGMQVMPLVHPRMASEQFGPTVVRELEPPGFLALHYGVRTPISVVISHLVFGGVLGLLYPIE